jgi:predicted  nucleic acid-binding Zn-ribbon protein
MPSNDAAKLIETLIGDFGGVSKNIRDTQKRLDDLTDQLKKAKTPDDLVKHQKEIQKSSQMLQALSKVLESHHELAKTVVQNLR